MFAQHVHFIILKENRILLLKHILELVIFLNALNKVENLSKIQLHSKLLLRHEVTNTKSFFIRT